MTTDRVHDPDLLDALEAMRPRPFDGTAWRVTWAARDPLIGGTGGGRWHPPNDFAALYTSLEEDGALAEIYHHLSRAPLFSSSHVKLNALQVRTEHTLTFPDLVSLAAVGVDEESFSRGVPARTREIGARTRAAIACNLEALIVGLPQLEIVA